MADHEGVREPHEHLADQSRDDWKSQSERVAVLAVEFLKGAGFCH
jgi:hypothetical protein